MLYYLFEFIINRLVFIAQKVEHCQLGVVRVAR